MRQDQLDDLAEQNACLTIDCPSMRIECDEPIQTGGQQQRAPCVQTNITIAATIAVREHWTGRCQLSLESARDRNETLLGVRQQTPGGSGRHSVRLRSQQ